MVGQLVLDHGEKLLEFGWKLRDGGEHHEKRPRACALRELTGGTDNGERVCGVLRDGRWRVGHREAQAGVAVPRRQPPVFGVGKRRDLANGPVGLVGLDTKGRCSAATSSESLAVSEGGLEVAVFASVDGGMGSPWKGVKGCRRLG